MESPPIRVGIIQEKGSMIFKGSGDKRGLFVLLPGGRPGHRGLPRVFGPVRPLHWLVE
jgi:hypothetical protein